MDPLIAFCHAFSIVAVWPNGNGERRVATAATLDAACRYWERSGARVIVGYLGDCVHNDSPMPDGGYAWGTLQASFTAAEYKGPQRVPVPAPDPNAPPAEPAPVFATALMSETDPAHTDRTDDPAMVAYQAEVAASKAAEEAAAKAEPVTGATVDFEQ